ncbi:MAG: hypothetical protein MJ252_01310 [archaeon]|nr:hypothetical protein [archaeon]
MEPSNFTNFNNINNLNFNMLGGYPGVNNVPNILSQQNSKINYFNLIVYSNVPMMPQISMPNINPNMSLIMNMPINPLMNKMPSKPIYESTKVCVSNIPENISDSFFLKLLETCGNVLSWKRLADFNGKLKSFGICEYQTVEGMLKCMRLLNNYPLEESTLEVKIGSETEEYLKQWREDKKNEWIDSLRMKGISVNMAEIKRKEEEGEALEWELQLLNKDDEVLRVINDLVARRFEIEAAEKQTEKSEYFLKDLKDLATGTLASHFESTRERERQKKKNEKLKKLDKIFKDEEKRWIRHEEDKMKEASKEKEEKEFWEKRIKKLIEADINFDSDEERKKMELNPKKYEAREAMRLKEKDYDDEMRKKDNGLLFEDENEGIEPICTTLVCQPKEPEAKTKLIIEEMEINQNQNEEENKKETLNLNLDFETQNKKINIAHKIEEDEEDIYTKKRKMSDIGLNPEVESALLNIKTEVRKSPYKDIEMKKIYNMDEVIRRLPRDKYINIQKSLIPKVPKTKEDIMKYEINWEIVNNYNIKGNKIKPWLIKEIKKYFSDDDNIFLNYLLDKIGNNSPSEILENVKGVLDKDSEVSLIF